MKKAALISVSDRTNLLPFARSLFECGYTLLTTSGSGKYLSENGVECVAIEQYTGQKEILDGRVKTLHPRIHAGLLAKHSDLKHRTQLEENDILPIEVAVVNLYPFIQNLTGDKAANPSKMVELIDIGGPTMIRAAAKNFASVYAVFDPADYDAVSKVLKTGQHDSQEARALRLKLSQKVFTAVAHYNLEISKYLSTIQVSSEEGLELNPQERILDLAPVSGMVLERKQSLRYGENPLQKAAFYSVRGAAPSSWQQLNGKELSYNNLLDFDAALRLIRALDKSKACAVIIKHLNPCGAAYAETLLSALQLAKKSDPRSHFGGVIAFNTTVTVEVAEEIKGDFAEIVLAPDFAPAALDLLRTNKNLRVIRMDLNNPAGANLELRLVEGGALLQERDPGVSKVSAAKVVSKRAPTSAELSDLEFAWELAAHVKSNAITIVKNGLLLAAGAGQMSRIDSAELALAKASKHQHDLKGAVVASDAFFPFPDSIQALAAAGVTAIIAPAGAKRDAESIESANSLGISLLFSEDRHFRH